MNEGVRLSTANHMYGIPATSLHDHAYGVTRGWKRGSKCVMSPKEEQEIVHWIMELQRLGHPISFTALRMKVADICETWDNPFTDGIPGRGWLRWWKKRHPKLSLRVAQGLDMNGLVDCVLPMSRASMKISKN